MQPGSSARGSEAVQNDACESKLGIGLQTADQFPAAGGVIGERFRYVGTFAGRRKCNR